MRNNITDLLQNIVEDYQEMYMKHESGNNELSNENSKLKEQIFQQTNDENEILKEKQEVELECSKYKRLCCEYEKMIRDLEDLKLNEKQVEKKETNKFNMMITQANELELKDRER